MRISELLESYKDVDPVELAKLINQQCHIAVASFQETKRLLYRGIWSSSPVIRDITPTNRIPVDVSIEHQATLDKILVKQRFKALRHNSIFCTADPSVAQTYGHLYVIFPEDGFNCTWSPKVADLWLNALASYRPDRITKFGNDLTALSPAMFVKEYDFKKDVFDDALRSRSEILIHGKYIAVRYYDGDDPDYTDKGWGIEVCKLLGIRGI